MITAVLHGILAAHLVHAHNWLHTPSRSTLIASTTYPFIQRGIGDIHAQIGPDQRIAVEVASGHGGDHHIAIISGQYAHLAYEKDYMSWIKDYVNSAPKSINEAKSKPRLHWCVGDNCNGVSQLSGVVSPGNAKYCNNRKKPRKSVYAYHDNQLNNDIHVYYDNPKYPWIVGAVRWRQVFERPVDVDIICLKVPYKQRLGQHMMVHWLWNGYYDAVDVNVFPYKIPDNEIYGKGNGKFTYKRIDHCQFIQPRKLFSKLRDATYGPGECKKDMDVIYPEIVKYIEGSSNGEQSITGKIGINIVPARKPVEVISQHSDVRNIPLFYDDNTPNTKLGFPKHFIDEALDSSVTRVNGKETTGPLEWFKWKQITNQHDNQRCRAGETKRTTVLKAVSECTWKLNKCWGIAVQTNGNSENQLFGDNVYEIRLCTNGARESQNGWRTYEKRLPGVQGFTNPVGWTDNNHMVQKISFGSNFVGGWKRDNGELFGSRHGVQMGWSCKPVMGRVKLPPINGNKPGYANEVVDEDTWKVLCNGKPNKWELAVPNGVYVVTMYIEDQTFQVPDIAGLGCIVENTLVSRGYNIENAGTHTVNVAVRDGRLTLSSYYFDPKTELGAYDGGRYCGSVAWIKVDKLQDSFERAWVPNSGQKEYWHQLEMNNRESVGVVTMGLPGMSDYVPTKVPYRDFEPTCAMRWFFEGGYDLTCEKGMRYWTGRRSGTHFENMYRDSMRGQNLGSFAFKDENQFVVWGHYEQNKQNIGAIVSVSDRACTDNGCPTDGETVCGTIREVDAIHEDKELAYHIRPPMVDCKGATGKYLRVRFPGNRRFADINLRVYRHNANLANPKQIEFNPMVCYGLESRVPHETAPEFLTTVDPQDPMFYSTCLVMQEDLTFRPIPGENVMPVDTWAFGGKCLDCESWAGNKNTLTHATPQWYFNEDCVPCKQSSPPWTNAGPPTPTAPPQPNGDPTRPPTQYPVVVPTPGGMTPTMKSPVMNPTSPPVGSGTEIIVRCAPWQGEVCSCDGGVLYYGLRKVDGRQATFEELLMKKYITVNMKERGVSELRCRNSDIGGDPLSEIPKQCFCVFGGNSNPSDPTPRPTPKPIGGNVETIVRCAEWSNHMCKCSGTVYFGIKWWSERPATYEEMIRQNHVVVDMAKKGMNQIDCAPYAIGKDPMPGQMKQCFCATAGGAAPPTPQANSPTCKPPTAKPVTGGGGSGGITHCAVQGGKCHCRDGTLYYGRKHPKGQTSGRLATYEEMMQDKHHVLSMQNHFWYDCANFAIKIDPLPGVKKQCFCKPKQ